MNYFELKKECIKILDLNGWAKNLKDKVDLRNKQSCISFLRFFEYKI